MNNKKGMLMYIIFMSILAVAVLYFLYNKYEIGPADDILFWGLLATVTETFLISFPSGVAVSVGLAVTITAMIICGPITGAIVAGIGFIFRMPVIEGERRHIFNTQITRTIFNISQVVVVIGIAGEILYGVLGYTKGTLNTLSELIPVVLIIILICEILNSFLVAIMINLMYEKNILETFVNNIKGIVPSLLGIGALGIIMALADIRYGKGVVVLFFAPLLVARYSFKLYFESQSMAMETIHALNDALEVKDAYTGGHATRVGEYAVKLAKASGMKKKEVEMIQTAALLHDIGKIGIPDFILNKKGKLTKEEYDIIKEHPVMGARILSNVDSLKDISNIIRHHHEKYDGTGYPDALKGSDIPIESAILAIADSFDAMTTDRPYKRAMASLEALDELKVNKGKQFNPLLVDEFIKVMYE
ncbi:HD-GYP domain-containing protein [Vallitalea sp.]|jgi:putative nucleotidyltransferase with HDIG domain|uniref:HD-GYP domain-containing protein n=1 Tax=Vallitalea sp. TaxID=1882829 RepID=UPI0025E776EF|nr:HD-GYP domain-containing protein [Vallitalea sp.]MCT4688706.1 HD-GYP domain-containing protein [Vallitalea sp.]